jgi:hypothetical protein
MKKNQIVMGLSTIVLVASLGGGLAQAKNVDGRHHDPMTDSDVVKTQNSRQKTPHSLRKEAAKRLKTAHIQEQQQHQQDGARVHHGQGQAEGSLDNDQTPTIHEGAK